ncbi:MAG TPA: DUF86 domain-containing protein [Vicinamibacterales bacterium]|jgi:uncharacterized protein YutE (UPF0331/DUF86 family)
MTLNADLVRSRCADIEEAVVRLERFGSMPVEQFVGNPEAVDAACYRLLVGVEAAIALCYHISAVHLRRVPEQYAACFDTLREAGIVPGELADRLKAMARFRNLLVHMYQRVEPARIHEILRNSLPDLRAFGAAVVRLI